MSMAPPESEAVSGVSVEHGSSTPNGVELHYVTAGPADGDLVVCLHGFPECWYTWKEQLPALVDAGFRVLAPDMRGANRSGKPSGRSAYVPDEMAADVAGLIEAFDGESAPIVGHDFGGLVAWHLAAKRPALVDRLAIMNSPNLAVYDRHLRSSFSQLRKSWYVFFYQLPRLPEFAMSSDDYAVIEDLYRENVDPAVIDEADVARFKAAAARDGALSAMITWYRGVGRWYVGRLVRRRGFADLAVSVPTLLCWGERDHALSVDLVDDHRDVVRDLRIERFPNAGHWVHLDEREQVNESLLPFLD